MSDEDWISVEDRLPLTCHEDPQFTCLPMVDVELTIFDQTGTLSHQCFEAEVEVLVDGVPQDAKFSACWAHDFTHWPDLAFPEDFLMEFSVPGATHWRPKRQPTAD